MCGDVCISACVFLFYFVLDVSGPLGCCVCSPQPVTQQDESAGLTLTRSDQSLWVESCVTLFHMDQLLNSSLQIWATWYCKTCVNYKLQTYICFSVFMHLIDLLITSWNYLKSLWITWSTVWTSVVVILSCRGLWWRHHEEEEPTLSTEWRILFTYSGGSLIHGLTHRDTETDPPLEIKFSER